MTDAEKRRVARKFAADWSGRGNEKSETQKFWIELLTSVLNMADAVKRIEFEKCVQLDHTSFIDGYIPAIPVLIEQKSIDVDLRKKQKQSDGTELTPFQQAKRYADNLSNSERPRFIVICNFASFLVYDMEYPHTEPEEILLANLPREYYRLQFLTDTGNDHLKREMELSIQAGEIVGVLYDEILKHYHDPNGEQTLKSLNMLCVRLVFCLYSEDAGIFGAKNQFHDYLAQYEPKELRRALIDLFNVLDTKEADRDPYLNEDLAAFPYVNGGLFADESIEIPQLDETVKNLLLAKASDNFDWCDISPTIFGAVFESTLNPETRRSGGMHYTSIENIHKVIDPLFLDALKSELTEIKALKITGTRNKRLIAFQEKLAGLTFLDPACGSGNFLTETYLSLRKLENEVLKTINAQQIVMNLGDVIKVSIGQFYGIELNDFAVTVAKTALWIAESQMMKETEDIVHMDLDFLPLKSYANIVEGNALRLDWNSVIPKEKLNYIMGNPPFVGARLMNAEQKSELLEIFHDGKNAGNLDYVCCWYQKSADFMTKTRIHAALVATNSITQGEQVALLWKSLLAQGIRIQFAHRTFRWDNEAKIKAHVHCVIVGFGYDTPEKPLLFNESGRLKVIKQISPYLIDAPEVFIESRSKPICKVPEIGMGNQPIDDGNYLFANEMEMVDFIKDEPCSEPYFKLWYGAQEFINSKPRYCLWLGDCPPNELRKMPECMKRVEAVRQFRSASKRTSTLKLADSPTRFQTENMPIGNYIVIPETSSESRQYTPIGFLSENVLCSNALRLMPFATLYHFGILTSNVHMTWMRAVCGRLEMRYRYSKDIVYNNFPWPEIPDADKVKIEAAAQSILDARALYPDCSLADLYDETTMPPELRKAHQANDRAVMKAYGFAPSMTEPEIVAELMKRYQALTEGGK